MKLERISLLQKHSRDFMVLHIFDILSYKKSYALLVDVN